MSLARRRIVLVSSSGGVLLDLLGLESWWHDHDVHWVAVRAPDTVDRLEGHAVTWVTEVKPADVIALGKALVQAWRVLRRHRPDLMLSAGSGVAVPWFLVGAVLRVPTYWVETFNVIGRPGLAARVCGRLAKSVLVQHQHLLYRRRRAVYVGHLY
jgi:Oligosaccharide biosynthesis protein Alg14 like